MRSWMNWVYYTCDIKESHPPEPGRYLVFRIIPQKMHFEQWNGSGWASSNNERLFWSEPDVPDSRLSKAITNL